MGGTLASQLATALKTARELTATLDKRVAERTEALTLANQRLEELSTTDSLTGLANRRHFDDILAKEWQRARRLRHPLALLMIDVDHFKQFNDTYGHLAGDDCLRQVAQILKQRLLRGSDTAARFGGEEFAVITSMDLEGALHIAELIRQDVENHPVSVDGVDAVHVSVSIGLSALVPDGSRSPAAADIAGR
ncbi:diguanylate cyclase [Alicycliphilus sp. B1]|nr:diguanylate cyclase [Alicycliphilus sp. B1]